MVLEAKKIDYIHRNKNFQRAVGPNGLSIIINSHILKSSILTSAASTEVCPESDTFHLSSSQCTEASNALALHSSFLQLWNWRQSKRNLIFFGLYCLWAIPKISAKQTTIVKLPALFRYILMLKFPFFTHYFLNGL